MSSAGRAVGGYRLLRQPAGGQRNAAVGRWLLNTAMVGGWTELFFRQKRLGASAAASAAMAATGTAYVVAAAGVDRPAAAVGVPFVAWLGFATLLAERVWQRNAPSGKRRDAQARPITATSGSLTRPSASTSTVMSPNPARSR